MSVDAKLVKALREKISPNKSSKEKKGHEKKYSHRSCRSWRRSTDLHNNSILGFIYARQNSSNAR